MRIDEQDTSFLEGKLTTYQLQENSEIFYELRHVKHINSYGDKLRIFSASSGALSIKLKTRLLGKPSVKSNIELSGDFLQILTELGNIIGTFEWTTQQHHSGWPLELAKTETLKFECKQIDPATEHLELIRKIHLELLD